MNVRNMAAVVGVTALAAAGLAVGVQPTAWGSGDAPDIQYTQPSVPAMTTGVTTVDVTTQVVNTAPPTLATSVASPTVKAT